MEIVIRVESISGMRYSNTQTRWKSGRVRNCQIDVEETPTLGLSCATLPKGVGGRRGLAISRRSNEGVLRLGGTLKLTQNVAKTQKVGRDLCDQGLYLESNCNEAGNKYQT